MLSITAEVGEIGRKCVSIANYLVLLLVLIFIYFNYRSKYFSPSLFFNDMQFSKLPTSFGFESRVYFYEHLLKMFIL